MPLFHLGTVLIFITNKSRTFYLINSIYPVFYVLIFTVKLAKIT